MVSYINNNMKILWNFIINSIIINLINILYIQCTSPPIQISIGANSCKLNQSILGYDVNFKQLFKKIDSYYHIDDVTIGNETGHSIDFNICGGLKNYVCGRNKWVTNAVCFHNKDGSSKVIGLVDTGLMIYDGYEYVLTYKTKTQECQFGDKKIEETTKIKFACDPSIDKKQQGKAEFVSLVNCTYNLIFKTPLLCHQNDSLPNDAPAKSDAAKTEAPAKTTEKPTEAPKLPPCALNTSGHYYNLRELSSHSDHVWNATDDNGHVYFINVCYKLPTNISCAAHDSAVCRCNYDEKNALLCQDSLGTPDEPELKLGENNTLVLSYKNGGSHLCNNGLEAETRINFICGHNIGKPKFSQEIFDSKQCIFEFEWVTFVACPVDERDEPLKLKEDRYLIDDRFNIALDVKPLLTATFNVTETRIIKADHEDHKDEYVYVINLDGSNSQFSNGECAHSAVCQTKLNSNFQRDLGSHNTISYQLRGNELVIVLESTSKKQKCGKNLDRNVKTIIRMQCVSSAGLGQPKFHYESNDCDYIFTWETSYVCLEGYLLNNEYEDAHSSDEHNDVLVTKEHEHVEQHEHENVSKSSGTFWLGFLLFMFLVSICLFYYIKTDNR